MAVQMELVGVRVDMPSSTPVLLLREQDGDRQLAIMIGHPEAQAIAFALDGVETRRPLTHDLIKLIVDELEVAVTQVVISALRDDIFYADIVLEAPDRRHVVSARPSDALAIAVRTGTPIFAEEGVLVQAGFVEQPADGDDDTDPDEVVEQFREFIDQVNPEDFAS